MATTIRAADWSPVGRHFSRAGTGPIYRCMGEEVGLGYWMENTADAQDGFGVSARSIGMTYHEVDPPLAEVSVAAAGPKL
jgi:hypothetical protein